MDAKTYELACPVLRKLVVLLESDRESLRDGQGTTFQERLAEIERDALLLGAAPGTRVLIQVAREVVAFSDGITARIIKA